MKLKFLKTEWFWGREIFTAAHSVHTKSWAQIASKHVFRRLRPRPLADASPHILPMATPPSLATPTWQVSLKVQPTTHLLSATRVIPRRADNPRRLSSKRRPRPVSWTNFRRSPLVWKYDKRRVWINILPVRVADVQQLFRPAKNKTSPRVPGSAAAEHEPRFSTYFI